MKVYNYILFDWDGCLADTLGLWVNTYIRVYKKFGFEVTLQDILVKSWANNEQGPKNIGVEDYIACWEDIYQEVQNGVESVELHSGAKDLLIFLKEQEKKIAIVTSAFHEVVEKAINAHDLGQYVDILIGADDEPKPKPDPEVVDYVLSRMGGKKEESIIIGDTPKDIKTGQNAGIDTVLYVPSINEKFYDFSEFLKCDADFTIRKLSSLMKLL